MASLASFQNKADFLSDPIPVVTTGSARVLVNMPIYGVGAVSVLIKNSAGVYVAYPGLTWTTGAAVQLPVIAGDLIKVRFAGCDGAGIEVDQ